MVFVDNLAYCLFAISIAGFMVIYSVASIYLSYKKNQKSSLTESIKGTTVPLLFLGIFMVVVGMFGQSTWPLPGAYNILFYDPLIAFGITLLSYSMIGRIGGNIEYVGLFALFSGAMAIIYGINGYNIGLTLEPSIMLAMFVFYGLAGILAYPIALIAQRLQKTHFRLLAIFIVLFCLSLFAASAIAGVIGFEAVAGHLANPP